MKANKVLELISETQYTNPMPQGIIIDLDGTLSDDSQRKHYAENNQFKEYNLLLSEDTRNEWCFQIIKNMMHEYKIIFLTGRFETYEFPTRKWLKEKCLLKGGYELIMRKNGDFRPAPIYKEDAYNTLIKDHYTVLFAIDDDPRNIEMWFKINIPPLQCFPGDFHGNV